MTAPADPRDGAPEGPGGLPRVPGRGLYTEAARQERLAWLRERTGAPLDALREMRLAPERLTGNVENLLGAVEVPLGLAGPLLFRGTRATGLAYAPLATTEGALVSSVSRGATALSRSGGVLARVLHQRMTRVPALVAPDLEGALRLLRFVEAHRAEIAEEAVRVSRHARLVSLEPVLAGRVVHVRFTYETGDAAGQNMTTACTWSACTWMRARLAAEGLPLEDVLVDGNLSGDKKVNLAAWVAGRGLRVVAEALVSAEALRQVLKVEPEHLLRTHEVLRGGAIESGMVGYSVNVPNLLAAVFIATGQDVACVHESGPAHLQLERASGGIRASLVLPSLIVGAVGGGTGLPAQRACLELMGCAGDGAVGRFAELLAGFALALDLSTMAAIATGQFAAAHERLGRNRPARLFGRDDLGPAFFAQAIADAEGDPGAAVDAVEPLERRLGSSILSELTSRRVSRVVGLLPLRVRWRTGGGAARVRDVLVKVKPLDAEVILMVNAMAAACGPRVAAAHDRFRDRTGFALCHLRELGLYAQRDPRFVRHAPRVLRLLRDDAREAYVLALELLDGLEAMDAADDLRGWTVAHVEAALRGIAEVHAIWLGREDALRAEPWLGPVASAPGMAEAAELWDALAAHASEEFPALVGPSRLARLREWAGTTSAWWRELERGPRTLVHGDFNPRNVAFRREPGGGLVLCAWDWELATLAPPQRDLAELLCFTLRPDVEREEVERLVDLHRRALEEASGATLRPGAWRDGYRASLRDLAINRFGLYLMAHTFRHYAFLERTVETLWRLLELEGDGA